MEGRKEGNFALPNKIVVCKAHILISIIIIIIINYLMIQISVHSRRFYRKRI
jgi:hypothetical protein